MRHTEPHRERQVEQWRKQYGRTLHTVLYPHTVRYLTRRQLLTLLQIRRLRHTRRHLRLLQNLR